ncbi:MAG TPA: MIP family channel protein [Thermoanaerobaculia bacterium]|nr:MIP family channel protein [Thermoanaerobaculia bacterium]
MTAIYSLSRRALAEFIGTLALIFVGGGSILSDKLSGGNVTLVGIALANGLTIAVMASAFGHISGAHLNPAGTLGAFFAKRISATDGAVYWISQLAGAAAGALLLTLVFDPATTAAASLATPGFGAGVSISQGLTFEIAATFFLVLVVCATAIDERGAFAVVSGLPIGFVVTVNILAGGPLTGAAMNPARAFGPAAVGGYWANHWVYWVGPLVGGAIAGLLYSGLYLTRRAVP